MTLRNLLSAKFDVRLRVVYNSFKVGQYFILKDRTPWPLTSNVVYKFQCPGDRAVSYIGMTTRQLVERVVEHFDPKRQSAVQDHVANCKNCSDSREPLSMFSILQQCRSNRDTAITEAILIYKYNPVLNKQLGKYRGCSFNVNVFSWWWPTLLLCMFDRFDVCVLAPQVNFEISFCLTCAYCLGGWMGIEVLEWRFHCSIFLNLLLKMLQTNALMPTSLEFFFFILLFSSFCNHSLVCNAERRGNLLFSSPYIFNHDTRLFYCVVICTAQFHSVVVWEGSRMTENVYSFNKIIIYAVIWFLKTFTKKSLPSLN